jgi:predicted Fe-Mo cluster-binding NifX family protein
MKVAFPLSNENELAIDFANSLYVGFYDESVKQVEMVSMQDMKNILAGMSFHEYLISRGLGAIISPQLNFLTLRILKENQIQAFEAVSNNLDENIRALSSNGLSNYQPVFSAGCSNTCGTCSSTCS